MIKTSSGACATLTEAVTKLGALQRKYGHLTLLRPVFGKLDAAARAVAAETKRVDAAARTARTMMDLGLDRYTAAERAATQHDVGRREVLLMLRSEP